MKQEKNRVKLGDKVKDPITGVIGIAVGRMVWLHGCARIYIQPMGVDKNKKPYDTIAVDEPQLEIVQTKKIKEGNHRSGGPRSNNNFYGK